MILQIKQNRRAQVRRMFGSPLTKQSDDNLLSGSLPFLNPPTKGRTWNAREQTRLIFQANPNRRALVRQVRSLPLEEGRDVELLSLSFSIPESCHQPPIAGSGREAWGRGGGVARPSCLPGHTMMASQMSFYVKWNKLSCPVVGYRSLPRSSRGDDTENSAAKTLVAYLQIHLASRHIRRL